jgi:NAD(P)-dependent dehydrogenase (short-subunit alcohol dehydrogenase family)
MQVSVEGKVAVITGGGNGVGKAIALAFGASGAKVVVNDYGVSVDGSAPSSAAAEAVAAMIRDKGGEAVANSDSVATVAGARSIMATAFDTFGRVDHVSACAGILRPATIFDMTEDQWDEVISTNLRGHFTVVQQAALHMRDRQAGSILCFTSTGGLEGSPNQPNYAATKEGIIGLARSVALSLAPYATCNVIAPGARSRMTAMMNPAAHATNEPEDIPPTILFLASDAARHITGQVIRVAGRTIGLYPQPRIARQLARDTRWTAEDIAQHWEEGIGFDPLLRYARFVG